MELLKSKSVKKWFRAYFNYGLMNYMYGGKRFLPCEMGTESCFLDPSGDLIACNGMNEKKPKGNVREKTYDEMFRKTAKMLEREMEINRLIKNKPMYNLLITMKFI